MGSIPATDRYAMFLGSTSELDAGAWSCGMVAGLIHNIPSCKELIDRIMAEAEAIISCRLEGLLAA